jgi:glycerol-3-phosphate dehydrogenase
MNRADLLSRAGGQAAWDVIVVGGGATGLGAGVDAAARGYSTLLLEQSDFAKGTSSRSTKLIHGGVRYLQQGDVSLVLEALHERGLLIRNAPHLVHHLAFVVPVYDWWEGPFYGIGLKLYDALAGKLGLGPSKLLSREETLERIPTVEPDGLRGGVIYFDGQFDDSRLAITLLRTLASLGGVPLNYARVTGLLKSGTAGVVEGVTVVDEESGTEMEIRARVVVNATGVFTDEVRRMDDPQAGPMVTASQGVHIVLDREFLPGDTAIMVPHTSDGRVLFAVPWHGRVVVGTTDTPVPEASLEPRALEDEIEFLLTHAIRYLTRDPLAADVLSVFAGLRPLVGDPDSDTKAISRDHTLLASPSGLVTITGGKWTTYRRMGADTIGLAATVGGLPEKPSPTETLKLQGWTDEVDPTEPLSVYGTDAAGIEAFEHSRPELAERLHAALPYRASEVIWAARHEMARTVEDVLARRLRALLLDARASVEMAPRVAELLAAELGRDEAWAAGQVEAYRHLASGYVLG